MWNKKQPVQNQANWALILPMIMALMPLLTPPPSKTIINVYGDKKLEVKDAE